MIYDTPPPPPPPVPPGGVLPKPGPEPRRTRYLPWVMAGCGSGLLIVVLMIAGLLLAFPQLRTEVRLLVAPPKASLPPPPDSPRAGEVARAGPLRIVDDFNKPSAAWEQADARLVEGSYELRVDTPNFDSYGLFLGANGAIGALDMAVDVTQVDGPPDAEYGIRFRQPGPENYLMFSISGSGYYRLLRVENGDYHPVVPWTFSPRIQTGAGAVNRLRIVAEGTNVRGYINGRQVLTAEDPSPQAGQLALGVTTFRQGGLAVRFDTIQGNAEGQDLAQDFSATTVPWSVGGSRIVDGHYELVADAGIQLLQQPQPPGSSRVRDFTLEVEASLSEGGEGSGYGVLFGYSENFTYYGLLLLPDGRLMLYQSAPDGGATLLPTIPVEALHQGLNQTNTIRVELREEKLTVAINDETVIDGEEIGQIEGEVGMLISSGETGAVARFDNFRLEAAGKRA